MTDPILSDNEIEDLSIKLRGLDLNDAQERFLATVFALAAKSVDVKVAVGEYDSTLTAAFEEAFAADSVSPLKSLAKTLHSISRTTT